MTDKGLQPLCIFLIVFPFFLSLAVVVTRTWKRIVERQFAVEDTILLIAEALIAVLTGTVWKIVVVSYSGYQRWNIPKGAVNVTEVNLWRWINGFIYNPILGLVKISFLITLLKLRSPKRAVQFSIWFLIAVNAVFIVLATGFHIFTCNPIDKAWHITKPGKCLDRQPYLYGVMGTTIATDVLVTAIPAWIIYDLQMSRKTKLTIISFLSLPLAVTAIGVYRLYSFVEVINAPGGVRGENPYNVRNSLSNIESNLGVIAVCGPTIKWMLGLMIPFFRGDPARPSYTYTPRKSPGFDRSRRYQKSEGDQAIELSVADFERKNKSVDGDSDTLRMMGDDGINKSSTATVGWTVGVGEAIPYKPATGTEPRTML